VERVRQDLCFGDGWGARVATDDIRRWAMALPEVEEASHFRLSGTGTPGDLAAENLLVREGRLAAVLDFGALSVGNPPIDLVPTSRADRAGGTNHGPFGRKVSVIADGRGGTA